MARFSIVLLVASLLCVVEAVEFVQLLGKKADPCAYDLWNERRNGALVRNCVQAGRRTTTPFSSNSIILPARNTHSIDEFTNEAEVVIYGRSFTDIDGGVGGSAGSLCIGAFDRDPAHFCTTGCVPGLATPALTKVNDTQLTFNLPTGPLNGAAWNQDESDPRPLCWIPGPQFAGAALTPIYTGFMIETVWNCNEVNLCTARTVANPNAVIREQILLRTTCCQSPAAFTGFTAGVGKCINPNLESCCDGTSYNLATEKCCNDDLQITAFKEGPCPCGTGAECPTKEPSCCTASKYPEQVVGVVIDRSYLMLPGQCYNPLDMKCCNVGERYDPGTYQCCVINGLQTLNKPCPCSADSHCAEDGHVCCTRGLPSVEVQQCNIYANFPSGQAPAETQRCLGVCIDTHYQTCCNGATCLREYETCCNTTCCNKFVGSCLQARREGALGFRTNHLEYGLIYEQCSLIESMDVSKGFFIFAFPAILMLASLAALALVLVFANKASARRYSFLERLIIILAVLSILFVQVTYFSPVWKYGLVTVIAGVVAIMTAAARVRWLNIFAIAVLGVAVIYLFDPFYGHAWTTLASERNLITGRTIVESSGILHATGKLWRSPELAVANPASEEHSICTLWYNYFVFDQGLIDTARYENGAIKTFGYCSRAWVTALLFVEGFVLVFVLLLFILAMLALIIRFRKQRFEPIELEVRGAQPGDEDFLY